MINQVGESSVARESNAAQDTIRHRLMSAIQEEQFTPPDLPNNPNGLIHDESFPSIDTGKLMNPLRDMVELATENSESDPAAVAMTLLTYFGVQFGTHAYLQVGETHHYPRLFSCIVGKTSKARKGTSSSLVKRLHKHADPDSPYTASQFSQGPLSTGEGLIYATRDPQTVKEGSSMDPGVKDKRLFLLEEEFSSCLATMKRKGNTLSSFLRSAWDDGNIAPLTKHNIVKTTNAHIGIVTHITQEELLRYIENTDIYNGFANRFLWVCAHRRKIVPLPQQFPDSEFQKMYRALVSVIQKAQSRTKIFFTPAAKDFWISIYEALSEERSGRVGMVTSRSEAQVLRLSLIHALLDGKEHIEVEHIQASLAIWEYCDWSAHYIFGNQKSKKSSIFSKYYQVITEALQQRGELKVKEMYKLTHNHIKREELEVLLKDLMDQGCIMMIETEHSGSTSISYRWVVV